MQVTLTSASLQPSTTTRAGLHACVATSRAMKKREISPRTARIAGGADSRGSADEGGETSGGCYLPGNQAFDYRPFNAGRLIPAGANIVIAQHYTPSGKDSVDFPQIGFTIAKETPKYRWVSGSVSSGGRLAIPPNEPNYQAPTGVRIRDRARL